MYGTGPAGLPYAYPPGYGYGAYPPQGMYPPQAMYPYPYGAVPVPMAGPTAGPRSTPTVTSGSGSGAGGSAGGFGFVSKPKDSFDFVADQVKSAK